MRRREKKLGEKEKLTKVFFYQLSHCSSGIRAEDRYKYPQT